MRKQNRELTYYIGTSLDGFIAGPNDEIEPLMAFLDVHEAIKEEWPETVPTHIRPALGIADAPNLHFDTLVMGRRTYDPGLAVGVTSPYSHMEQYVFTNSLSDDTDKDVNFVSGDPLALVRDLKAREGKGIWLCGGANLASALASEIDQIIVKRYPVLFGGGIPMFAGAYEPVPFTLTENRVFESGAAIQTYRKA
ncbi:dihydrofolate reductase family protein [Glycomyces algeriensis]|uniref:Deaminase n=1 Tax=Glycomyces algeriensis TaxID=256037 RepID=A0A9W6GAY0_9ACTN|nr:dihydrofolate reductase family protein [Glycomyces algeriensis]MDA1368287.1 dihydrofolate reductase family protein [Glycomyces algeriensis]MDR7351928.1 dihydrofolate reductase [Glycomyces algeriensis]GLI44659.1 deaminase [Glycomyces algeriensis]